MLGLTLTLAALTCAQSDAAQVFAYDAEAPFRIEERAVDDVRGVRVIDMTYASPQGGRVPAYLVVPPGEGPFAAVIFAHMGGSDRELYISLVVDLRRAIDLLVARNDVDGSRVGFVGHSLGATWGGVLAGIERRLKAFVLIAGVADPGNVSGDDPYAKLMQSVLGADPEQLEHYESMVSTIAARHFIGEARPGSILFQFAHLDSKVSKARADDFAAVAGPSHEVRWYVAGHEFHDERATEDRRLWLADKLNLQE